MTLAEYIEKENISDETPILLLLGDEYGNFNAPQEWEAIKTLGELKAYDPFLMNWKRFVLKRTLPIMDGGKTGVMAWIRWGVWDAEIESHRH